MTCAIELGYSKTDLNFLSQPPPETSGAGIVLNLLSHRLLLLSLLVGSSVAPLFAQAADLVTITPTLNVLAGARDLEKARRWEDAAQAYLKVWVADRANTDAHEGVLRCLRSCFQSTRHRDPALLAQIHAMTPAEVLALYSEVITKIQAYYVDPERASPLRLFRQGLDEFLAALGEPTFIERYLKGVDPSAIAKFRANIQKAWLGRDVQTPRIAVELVAEIATASRRTLGLRTIHPVVAEFICGACNSLDEYSAYLSGIQFTSDSKGGPLDRSVDVRLHDGDVVLLKVSHFHQSTPQEIEEALKPIQMARQIRALILDLRGNTGGSLMAAIKTAEKFLPGGIIVSAQGPHDEVNKVYTSISGPAALEFPMIVLVDGETASAAEVLAIALRDNRRAKLIGTATFGKGTVQNVVKFTTAEEIDPKTGQATPRAAIRITLARLIGPSGAQITGIGATPNEVVMDRFRQDEVAMDQARELARRYVPGMSMMRQ